MASWKYACFVFLNSYGFLFSCRFSVITERKGQRCVPHNSTDVFQARVDHNHCVVDCMRRKNCHGLNYDHARNMCYIFHGQCLSLETDEKCDMTSLGTVTDLCLRWFSVERDLSFSEIFSSNPSNPSKWYIGRLRHGVHTLPGKLQGNTIYSVLERVMHTKGAMEVLHVLPGCKVTWVSFNAGWAIPQQAVIGGYLANGPGSILYVIRGQAHRSIAPGYYNPATEKGYIENSGPHEVDHMEILIITD